MSWFARLKSTLSKSSKQLQQGFKTLITGGVIDEVARDNLQDALISADFGVTQATYLANSVVKKYRNQDVSAEVLSASLQTEIATILQKYARDFAIPDIETPVVFFLVGVNGNGKTTSAGKLAAYFKHQGIKVGIVAADTFRAAAVDQVRTWAQRADVRLYAGKDRQDPASLVYESYLAAKNDGIKLLLVDTAGRLHTKQDLMESLGKMVRVIKKHDQNAPHEIILVLDATTGQSAHNQAKLFKEHAGITGFIVTKLDGTARGGVVVALSADYQLPVFMIGVGEAIDDLKPFNANDYASALV